MTNLNKKLEVVQLIQTLSGMTPTADEVAWPESRWKQLANQLNDLKSASRDVGLNPIGQAATEIHDLISSYNKTDGSRKNELVNSIKHRLRSLKSKFEEKPSTPIKSDAINLISTSTGRDSGTLRIDTDSVKQGYLENLPKRFDEIQINWDAFARNPESASAHDNLYQQLHQLSGNAATFGFSPLGEAAKEILDLLPDDYLSAATMEASGIGDKIESLLKLGHALLEEAKASTDSLSSTSAPSTVPWETSAFADHLLDKGSSLNDLIYLVDDDAELATLLSAQIEYYGFTVKHFPDLESFQAAFAQYPPSLIIMDIMFPEDEITGAEAIEQLRKDWKQHIPVVYISAKNNAAKELALKPNGDAFCEKPVDIDLLINEVFRLTDASNNPDFNILVLHHTEDGGESCTKRLEEAGLNPLLVGNPKDLIEKLKTVKPNLLLIDIQSDSFNGVALAKMLRQQDPFMTLPIIFLATQKPDAATTLACRALGEEILPVPVPIDILRATVKRIFAEQRSINYQIQSAAHLDSWTGLHNREHYLSLLGLIHKTRVAPPADKLLLTISLDNFSAISEATSIATTNQLLKDIANILKTRLPAVEIAARIGEAKFSAVAHVTSAEEANVKALQLQKTIERHPVESRGKSLQLACSIGCELFSRTKSADKTYQHAVDAIKEAQFNGGNQVVFFAGDLHQQEAHESDEEIPDIDLIDCDNLKLLYQAILNLRGSPKSIYQVMAGKAEESGQYSVIDQHLREYETPRKNALFDKCLIEHLLSTGKHQYLGETGCSLIVELSEGSLRDPQFPQWLKEQITNSRIKAAALGFTLAEEGVSRHPSLANKLYKQLQEIGCKTILGNFSGSDEVLQILKFLPVEFIRVDAKYINNIHQQKQDLRKLVDTARNLGIALLAPEVAHAEIMGILWELGVDYVQGSFIHEPSVLADYDFSQGFAFGSS